MSPLKSEFESEFDSELQRAIKHVTETEDDYWYTMLINKGFDPIDAINNPENFVMHFINEAGISKKTLVHVPTSTVIGEIEYGVEYKNGGAHINANFKQPDDL
jgi:hypothetical protein